MNKIAIVYWSGTGNTEMMAQKVMDGAAEAGGDVKLFTAGEFSGDMLDEYDAVAFGCPSMGAEELEDSEFAPMFLQCEGKLAGKRVGLFGSYGWGDGEWMRNWTEQVKEAGAELACESVICNDSPDDEANKKCWEMGRALA